MGQETKQLHYTKQQEKEFHISLKEETKLLKQWIKDKCFKNSPKICGYEAEGWIIKEQSVPYACSDKLLESIADSHITPELSKFNFEINGNPCHVNNSLPRHLEKDFHFYWKKCSDTAAQHQGQTLFIGTYPDLTKVSFGMKQIYPRNRYYAINSRIHSLRKKPVHIKIEGGQETLILDTSSIMHEAETTSLQIHLQIHFSEAKDFYNASLIASPIMSALCANSPFVCGKELWDETRIPLFEKVISLEIMQDGRKVSRVGLSHGFVNQCISELFDHNLLHPVLLPEIKKNGKERLQHLLFHNGTIWRWNRPLIGFDEAGHPHFRIEHRVPSAGPSLVDMQANILFFIGLVHLIKKHISHKKLYTDFQTLEKFFYRASQFGLSAEMEWLNGKVYKIHQLVSEQLIDPVREELNQLSLTDTRTDYLIKDVIKNRAISLQNGSFWQKSFIQKYGKHFDKMIKSYWQNQQKNIPVYQWKI